MWYVMSGDNVSRQRITTTYHADAIPGFALYSQSKGQNMRVLPNRGCDWMVADGTVKAHRAASLLAKLTRNIVRIYVVGSGSPRATCVVIRGSSDSWRSHWRFWAIVNTDGKLVA